MEDSIPPTITTFQFLSNIHTTRRDGWGPFIIYDPRRNPNDESVRKIEDGVLAFGGEDDMK